MPTLIKYVIFIIVAIFVALYLGIGAATDQIYTLAKVVIVGSIAVCLAIGRKIWLVLPLLMGFQLTLKIPGSPSTMELAQVIVCGFVGLSIITSRISWRIRITELEILALLLLVCVVQVYLRNHM